MSSFLFEFGFTFTLIRIGSVTNLTGFRNLTGFVVKFYSKIIHYKDKLIYLIFVIIKIYNTLKNLYLIAFLAILAFALNCGRSEKQTIQSKNDNAGDVRDESKLTDNKQTDNKETNSKEHNNMDNSGNYKTVEIKTTGMSCSHCENSVKTSVSKLDGVKEVIADAKTNTAKVTFDDGKTNIKEIEKAITEAGYGVLEPVQ